VGGLPLGDQVVDDDRVAVVPLALGVVLEADGLRVLADHLGRLDVVRVEGLLTGVRDDDRRVLLLESAGRGDLGGVGVVAVHLGAVPVGREGEDGLAQGPAVADLVVLHALPRGGGELPLLLGGLLVLLGGLGLLLLLGGLAAAGGQRRGGADHAGSGEEKTTSARDLHGFLSSW